MSEHFLDDDKEENEEQVLCEAETGGDLATTIHTVEIQDDDAHTHLHVSVDTCKRCNRNQNDDELCEPPTLFIYNDDSTALKSAARWEWNDDGNWSKCLLIMSSQDDPPPHSTEDPTVSIDCPKSLKGSDNATVFDFDVEVYGHVVIKFCFQERIAESDVAAPRPRLFVGESVSEAIDDDLANQEQSTELIKLKGGVDCDNNPGETWISAHMLAFRYVRVDVPLGASVVSVSCEASFRPAQYKGAFASSDPNLTKIWMHSAYTLRMCMHHDFLLDGMKRDRLPWAGDLAISLLSNAYTFADAAIIARSLTVLGRAGIAEEDINGFIDYDLWWIICHDMYQTYFGDINFLHREWHRLTSAVENLVSRCDHRGLLIIEEEMRNDMVFIDWVDVEKYVPLQVLWWWALDKASSIAFRVACSEKATGWSLLRDKVRETLVELFWDSDASLWRASLDIYSKGKFSRHACILSVVSGLTDVKKADKIVQALLQDDKIDLGSNMRAAATPYMKMFECLALSKAGNLELALDRMRYFWSAMLDDGASTFYEAYSIDARSSDKTQASFYGRPFGNSLCHAWSSVSQVKYCDHAMLSFIISKVTLILVPN